MKQSEKLRERVMKILLCALAVFITVGCANHSGHPMVAEVDPKEEACTNSGGEAHRTYDYYVGSARLGTACERSATRLKANEK